MIVLRHRGEWLGVVEAVDVEAAERAAIKLFRLDQVQAKLEAPKKKAHQR